MERNNVNVTGLMKDHLYTTSMRWGTLRFTAFMNHVLLVFLVFTTYFSSCLSQVNLVSEHIWCKDFLVRSFYLKNVQTQETRTLTQFHLLSWPAQGIPTSTRPLLDFRRYCRNRTPPHACNTADKWTCIAIGLQTGHSHTHTHILKGGNSSSKIWQKITVWKLFSK